jgi:hypothetical protein
MRGTLARMTRLLVVHPNPLIAWDRAAALEHAGYEVETCPGPADAACPILADQPCPLLDRADVLIYDAALGSAGEMQFLVAHLRDAYADLPLVVIGPDAESWTELAGPRRVWRVPQVGTVGQLAAVVEEALTEQGMAV